MDADFFWVRDTATVLVAFVFKVDSTLSSVLAEQIGVTIPVACRDELFQLQFLFVVKFLQPELQF